MRIEEIRVKNRASVIDTVILTHHGPVVSRNHEEPLNPHVPINAAMQWTAHDPSNELKCFIGLNHATNYKEFVNALSFFDCPAQNFVFASQSGDIAIWHNGKFPVRWKGQGRTISDGTDPRYEWQGWIPRTHLPHIKNPERGFVSSANQHPTDGRYPYYLDWHYAPHLRAARINESLASLERMTPADMIRLQIDVLNLEARMLLPFMLKVINNKPLNQDESGALDHLKKWRFENQAQLIAPTIFNHWWEALYGLIWEHEINLSQRGLMPPGKDVTIAFILSRLKNSSYGHTTNQERKQIENIIHQSFRSAHAKLTEKLGPLNESWAWRHVKGTNIFHLAKIPGLSRLHLETSGYADNVNATSRTFGPSWRMVVQLGPEVKGWGIYPGGQSGNPGSAFYDAMIDDWIVGKIYELNFIKSPDDQAARSFRKITMGVDK
jgi:penicillin amidase